MAPRRSHFGTDAILPRAHKTVLFSDEDSNYPQATDTEAISKGVIGAKMISDD